MANPRDLIGRQAIETPPQAKALYNHPRWHRLALLLHLAAVLPWCPATESRLAQLFADVRARFRYRADAQAGSGADVWGNWWVRLVRQGGRYVRLWFGDCDDFAWLIVLAAVKAGYARGAVRLCMVSVAGAAKPDHLVAVVETDAGSLVMDHRLPRPVFADDPMLRAYRFHSIESPGKQNPGLGCWRLLMQISLSDVWPLRKGGAA